MHPPARSLECAELVESPDLTTAHVADDGSLNLARTDAATIAGTNPRETRPPRRYRWSLQTLLLLLTVAAAWTAHWKTRAENRRLASRIRSIQEVAREISIGDLKQFAAVRRPEEWMDDNRWTVYLPDTCRHHLYLATEQIDTTGFPKAVERIEIPCGQHHLELHLHEAERNWCVEVKFDGKTVIDDEMPKDWYLKTGHSQIGIFKNEVLPIDQPLLLMRRRFMSGSDEDSNANTPRNGILLWIEATPQSPPRA